MSFISGFHHVSLLVRDTARALDFYHGLLGLPLARRPELGFDGAWLDLGQGQQIHLLEVDGVRQAAPSRHGGRDYHVALFITDLDAVCAVLDAAGVTCTRSRSGRRALFCRDPDGNAVELVERER